MKFAISFFIILLSFSASCDTNDSLRIKELFDPSTIQIPGKQPRKNELIRLSRRIKGNSLEGLFYYEWSRYMFYQAITDSAESVAITGLKRISQTKNVERDKIKLLNILAAIQSTRMNYEKGVKLYEEALNLAEHLEDSIQMAYINNNLANVFFSLQDYPKAYYYSSTAFQLIKIGTPLEPITFTGENQVAGAWEGIVFNYSNSTNNIMRYCEVGYGGNEPNWNGLIYLYAGARLTLGNSSVHDSQSYGIMNFNGTNTFIDEGNNSYYNNASGNIGN